MNNAATQAATLIDALNSIADHASEFEAIEDWETMVFRMREKAVTALKIAGNPLGFDKRIPALVKNAIRRMDECRAGCEVGDPFYADAEAWDVLRIFLNGGAP